MKVMCAPRSTGPRRTGPVVDNGPFPLGKGADMAIQRWFRRWLREDDGVSTVLLALTIVPLIGFIGLAVDGANLYMVHSRLSYATDAAALAGGRVFAKDTRNADVQAYLDANFPNGMFGATVSPATITESADHSQLTVDTAATVPTMFMQIFGFRTVRLTATSTVEPQGGVEVALVLDVTGSMCMPCSKLTSMQAGAKDLLDTIYDPSAPADAVYAAVVPFRTAVNIGSKHTDWIDSSFNLGSSGPFLSEGWRGCVEQRDPNTLGSDGLGLDISDQVPSSGYKFKPYLYENTAEMGPNKDGKYNYSYQKTTYDRNKRKWVTTTVTETYTFDNNWPKKNGVYKLSGVYGSNEAAVGPNLNCPETPVTPLSPLATDKAKLEASIDSFTTVVRGGTQIVDGLVWGWHVLSDDWQSYWGTDISTTRTRAKVLVLLTDGDNQVYDWDGGLPGKPLEDDGTYGNNSDYTAYGRLRPLKSDGTVDTSKSTVLGATDIYDLRDKLTDRQLAACDAIKKQGITIYTIGYQVPSSAVDGLQKCASDPDKYFSASSSTIEQTFKDIGKKLTKLRIVK
jgi:Flp pilus assembly protein TadG